MAELTERELLEQRVQRAYAHSRVRAEVAKRSQEKFFTYFPDCTSACLDPTSPHTADHAALCRKLYEPRHIAWMHGGAKYFERLFLAANRIGKTEAAAYETTAHLTGLYPHWWQGKRFTGPTEWWIAGDTMLSTRNIVQVAMLGKIECVETGRFTGMIPSHLVDDYSRKSGGVALCVDKVWIKHVDPDGNPDGLSTVEFLSYDQGRRVFQGTAKHGIWLDEEPPDPPHDTTGGEGNDIYTECLLRTAEINGIVMATFTPLRGLTPFVNRYLDDAVMPDSTGEFKPAKDVLFEKEAA